MVITMNCCENFVLILIHNHCMFYMKVLQRLQMLWIDGPNQRGQYFLIYAKHFVLYS